VTAIKGTFIVWQKNSGDTILNSSHLPGKRILGTPYSILLISPLPDIKWGTTVLINLIFTFLVLLCHSQILAEYNLPDITLSYAFRMLGVCLNSDAFYMRRVFIE